MTDHMSRKEVLSKRQSSATFEWKEDEQAARQAMIHQSTSVLRRSLSLDGLKDSGIHDHSSRSEGRRPERSEVNKSVGPSQVEGPSVARAARIRAKNIFI